MKDQHTLITGYRDLSQPEIDIMNEFKALEKQVMELVARSLATGSDGRWSAIGKTHLQQGFMAAIRAVAKPEE